MPADASKKKEKKPKKKAARKAKPKSKPAQKQKQKQGVKVEVNVNSKNKGLPPLPLARPPPMVVLQGPTSYPQMPPPPPPPPGSIPPGYQLVPIGQAQTTGRPSHLPPIAEDPILRPAAAAAAAVGIPDAQTETFRRAAQARDDIFNRATFSQGLGPPPPGPPPAAGSPRTPNRPITQQPLQPLSEDPIPPLRGAAPEMPPVNPVPGGAAVTRSPGNTSPSVKNSWRKYLPSLWSPSPLQPPPPPPAPQPEQGPAGSGKKKAPENESGSGPQPEVERRVRFGDEAPDEAGPSGAPQREFDPEIRRAAPAAPVRDLAAEGRALYQAGLQHQNTLLQREKERADAAEANQAIAQARADAAAAETAARIIDAAKQAGFAAPPPPPTTLVVRIDQPRPTQPPETVITEIATSQTQTHPVPFPPIPEGRVLNPVNRPATTQGEFPASSSQQAPQLIIADADESQLTAAQKARREARRRAAARQEVVSHDEVVLGALGRGQHGSTQVVPPVSAAPAAPVTTTAMVPVPAPAPMVPVQFAVPIATPQLPHDENLVGPQRTVGSYDPSQPYSMENRHVASPYGREESRTELAKGTTYNWHYVP